MGGDSAQLGRADRGARVAAEQTPEPWSDERSFDEDGPAFDRADYMREDGDTEARVVRRWR